MQKLKLVNEDIANNNYNEKLFLKTEQIELESEIDALDFETDPEEFQEEFNQIQAENFPIKKRIN